MISCASHSGARSEVEPPEVDAWAVCPMSRTGSIPHRRDPAPQFSGEVRTIRAELLGCRLTSLLAKVVPLDEQIEQPIFNG